MQSDSQRQELPRLIKDAASRQDASSTVQYSRTLLTSSAKPADAMFCASALAAIADALAQQPQARRLKAHIVRSVTVEPILPFLTTEAVLSNYVLDMQVGGYGSYRAQRVHPPNDPPKLQPHSALRPPPPQTTTG